jgi:transglutaminase-like putative cysteine protease
MESVKAIAGLLAILLLLACSTNASTDNADTFYYAIEKRGVLTGYSEVSLTQTTIDGRAVIIVDNKIESHVIALGASVDSYMSFVYHVDSATNQYFYHTSDIDQGKMKIGGIITIVGDTVFTEDRPDGKQDTLCISPEIVRECSPLFSHVLNKLKMENVNEIEYEKFSEIDGNTHDVIYSKVGTEELTLSGKNYNTMIVSVLDKTIGIRSKIWLNMENGYVVQSEVVDVKIYLTDKSVKNNMEKVDLDANLFSKVDEMISDIKSISYMKVYAVLEPGGVWITPESLNNPGQSFEGTVEENHVDGVFELNYRRYDGTNAPVYPDGYDIDESIRKYLEPEDMIESDDPELLKRAKQLVEGSTDSWEAMKRLGQWISDEISYDIPGGGTAKKTFEIRLGECGSHSRLMAAMCRAAGIPARMVWGCIYTPNYGGSFGQHAWNEVYMGEEGWIPIDVTAEEIDYVDCGHIRLGEAESKTIFFNPIDMTIVEYDASGADPVDLALYEKYVGKYQAPEKVFEILIRNGCLAVDIPDQLVCELKNPDENGNWVLTVSDQVWLAFQEDNNKVTSMTLTQITRVPRNYDSEKEIDSSKVPDEYLGYLGCYSVPMQGFDLTVLYQDNNLAVNDPTHGIIKLKDTDQPGRWRDEFDQNDVSFDINDEGKCEALIFHAIVPMMKIK